MFSKLHIGTFIGTAVLIWAGVLWVQDIPLSLEQLGPYTAVVSTMFGIMFIFDKWAWAWPPLHGWFVKRPDLRGTWRVDIQSNWIDPKTGSTIPVIIGYVGVRQSLSTLQMHLMTPESESLFIADNISPSPTGSGYQVVGVYRNQPRNDLRGIRSEMHHGALVLNTHGTAAKPDTIKGEYWTDRETTGQMDFAARKPAVYSRYDDAQKAYESDS